MKKIFYLVAILIAFISCNSNYKTTITSKTVEHVDIVRIEENNGIYYS